MPLPPIFNPFGAEPTGVRKWPPFPHLGVSNEGSQIVYIDEYAPKNIADHLRHFPNAYAALASAHRTSEIMNQHPNGTYN
jgi:hypothetical protein